MALAVASSTVSLATASATVLLVPYPASIGSTDYGVLIVATKPFNASIQTPAGWTLLGTRTNGTTAAGTDTGSMLIAVFVRKFAGGETGNLSVSITSGNSSWGVMYRVTRSPTMDVQAAFTSGLDTVANTSLSVPFDANPGITSGDLLVMGIAWPTDLARTVSASSFAATSATFSGIVAAGNQNPRTTTGLDSGGNTNSCLCASGTATAAPTWSATLSVATNGTGPAVLVRLREFPPVEISGDRAVTMAAVATGDVPVSGGGGASTGFALRKPTGGSTLRSGATLRGVAAPVDIDGTRPSTVTLTAAAAVTRPAAGTLAATATLTGAAAVARPASGTLTATATGTGAATVARAVSGTTAATTTLAGAVTSIGAAAGTLAGTATLVGGASVTRPAGGTLTATATATGAAVGARPVTGTTSATATATGAAAVTRPVSGTTAITATIAGTGDLGVVTIDGTLALTANRTGTAVVAKLFKTLHKSLGHAPASIADMETAFSPDTASGGWHRGDGVLPIHGTGWSLYCFNDFYVSDGAGGVQVFFRRNSVLMVDHDDGQVWWLSSGDGFGIAGSVTFPGPPEGGGSWAWLSGGWATGASSCMLLGGTYSAGGSLVGYRVMAVTGLTGSTPPYSVTHPCALPTSVQWHGTPNVAGGHVYVYGIDGLTQVLARAAVSTDPAAYGAGMWEYWTGSGWSTTFGDRGGVTVESPPLRALSFIAWQGRYLASAKDFDSAPELGLSRTDWTELKVWVADNPWGPWAYHGIVADTEVTDWWSYAARAELFPGMDQLSVIWSINTNIDFDPDLYGPQFAVPDQVGHLDATAALTGAAGFVHSSSGNRAATASLTGDAAVTRTVSGDRAVAVSTAGAATLVVAVAGTRPVTATVTGAATATVTVAGTRTVTATPAGAAASTVAVSGTLTVTASSAGTGLVVAQATGARAVTATIAGAGRLDAAADGTRPTVATATGAAAAGRPVDGTTGVTATSTGSAAAARPTSGDRTATATTAGTVAAGRPVSGTSPVEATLAGTAEALAPGTVGGDLALTATTAGGAQLTLPAAGTCAATAALAGAAAVVAPTSGTLTGTATLAGAVTVTRPIAGTVAATAGLAGVALVDVNAAGTLPVAANRAADGQALHPVAGTLAVTATVTGTSGTSIQGALATTATAVGSASRSAPTSGDLAAAADITGDATLAPPAAGERSIAATLAGAAAVTRSATGDLTVTATRTGTVDIAGAPPGIHPVHGTGPVDDLQASPAYNPGTGTLTLSGTTSAGAAARVTVTIDAGTPANATGVANWTYLVDVSAWARGPHPIVATVLDPDDEVLEQNTVTVWHNPGGIYTAASTEGEHLVPAELTGVT